MKSKKTSLTFALQSLKIIILMIMLMAFLPFSSALSITTNIQSAIPQGLEKNITIQNDDNTAACNSTIFDREGSVILNTASNPFSIPAQNQKGLYDLEIRCATLTDSAIYEKSFYVTKDGFMPANDILTAVIYFIFIFALIGIFATFLIGLAKLATASTTIYDVALSWSFIVLLIVVIHLSSQYLLTTFVEDLSNTFMSATIWTNGVLPLISFIISLFIRATQKKRPLSVTEIAGVRLSHG